MKKIVKKNKYIVKQKGKLKLVAKTKNHRIKPNRRKIKNKIFLKSLRRPRPKFKFLCYNNKFRYRQYIASLKNYYTKQKYKRGAVSPKYQIKNYLEQVSKLNRSLFKSRNKKFNKLQGRRNRKFYFRKKGLQFIRKRKKIFKFNTRVLFSKRIKRKKNLKLSKKLKIIIIKKLNKQKKNLIKILKKQKNRVINVIPLNYTLLKTRRYIKKIKNQKAVFKIIQKIIKYINILKLGSKKRLKKRYQNKIIKSILTLGFVPNSIFIMLPKFLVGVKGKKKIRNYVLQNKKYSLNPKRIWNLVYQCILQKFLKTPNISSNLTKHYKLKINEMQSKGLIIGAQRQANTLNLINLLIAKKRQELKNRKISEISQVQTFISKESLNINMNNDSYNIVKNPNNISISISIMQKDQPLLNKCFSLISYFNGTNKQSIRDKLLKKYLYKNKILKNKKVVIKNSKQSINHNKKKNKTEVVNVSKKPMKILKIKAQLQKSKKRPRNSLFLINIWNGTLLNNLKKPLTALYKKRKLKKKVKKQVLKNQKIKTSSKVLKNKKVKKNNIKKRRLLVKKKSIKKVNKKDIWLSKKNAFKKNRLGKKPRKKKKGKRKRGKKNLEKRRRLQKIAHFIRPRILTHLGYQAYAKHSNSRGLLNQFLKVKPKIKKKLKKKIYTKTKKQQLLAQLLTKHFKNENKNKIIKQLKGLDFKKIVNKSSTRYFTVNYLNFIKDYIKTFYIILDASHILQATNEKAILKKAIKNNKGAFIIKKFINFQKKQKNLKLKTWLNNNSKIVANKILRRPFIKKIKAQVRINALRKLVNSKNTPKAKVASNWVFKRNYRNFLEIARRNYSKGDSVKCLYRNKKIKLKRTKFISRKILKAHRKAKRKGKQIQKNLIKASYYYYFKKLRYDRIILDKLNYKEKGIKISSEGRLKLSKFLIYLLMRVYLKKTSLKRTNVRLGVKRIKRETKKNKITKKIRITAASIKKYTKKVSGKSKKYIGLLKKTVLIKVLIKLLRSLLRSTANDYRAKIRRRKIKEIIKIFVFPLLINKRQIQKVRLRKKNKIYLVMAQIFLYNIKQIVNSANYSINFFGLIGSNITAAYVMRRLMERLEKCKGGGLWFIPKVMKKIMNSKHVVGFKVKFSGRLTGNSMAQQSIMKKGIIGNSNMNVYIDYAQDNIIRKHGKCGLKIWIVRNLLTYMPYKYVYTYNYKR